MSTWRDPAKWNAVISGAACPICRGFADWTPVAKLRASWVMAEERGPMPGYCWVPLRRHPVELHDLGRDEAAAYMHDLQRVSEAVQAITGAV